MTSLHLRTLIKKSIDEVPPSRLASLADYVAFLARPPLKDRLRKAEREIKAGKGVAWRSIKRDV